MILLDDPSLKSHSFSTLNTRSGPVVAAGRLDGATQHRSISPLPDYETSEAQHNPSHRPLAKRVADARFWRATCVALALYVGMTVVCGVPFLIVRLSTRRAHWVPPPSPLPWNDEGVYGGRQLPEHFLSESDVARCNPWQTFAEPLGSGEFFSARFQQAVPPTGPFTFRSNISLPLGSTDVPSTLVQNINGTFTVAINPSPSSKALLSVLLQTSNPQLRDHVHLCFRDDSPGSTVLIYVPDTLATTDKLNFTLTLLLPSSGPSISNILSPSASLLPPSLPLAFKTEDNPSLQIPKLTTHLPRFSHYIEDLTLGQGVEIRKVTIEGAEAPVHVKGLRARKVLIKTSLAEISGTFNVSGSLTLDTIGAPINANVTLQNDLDGEEPTYLSLDTGESTINAQVNLEPSRYSSSFLSSPRSRERRSPAFIAHLKTFSAPLSASFTYSPLVSSTDNISFRLHTHNDMAPTDVALLGRPQWYEGTFDVQTKLARAIVVEGGKGDERAWEYDHISAERVFGWVGKGRRKKFERGHVEIVTSMRDVALQIWEDIGTGTETL